MHRFTMVVAIIATVFGLFLAEKAHAGKEFECFAYAGLRDRMLFNNTGGFASDRPFPVLINVADCTHESWFYVNLFSFSSVSFRSREGWETDQRFGSRFTALGLKFDLSGALYQFGVSGKTHHVLDARAKVSRDFPLSPQTKVGIYGLVDYQHPLTPRGDDWVGLAAGAWFSTDLPMPGNPNFRLGTEIWKWVQIPTPGSGPIFSATVRIGFPFLGVLIGPEGLITVGSIDGSNHLRGTGGVFISGPFSFNLFK